MSLLRPQREIWRKHSRPGFSTVSKKPNTRYFRLCPSTVATTQLSHCSMQAATEDSSTEQQTNGWVCVAIKVYVQKQAVGPIWLQASLLTLEIDLESLFPFSFPLFLSIYWSLILLLVPNFIVFPETLISPLILYLWSSCPEKLKF